MNFTFTKHRKAIYIPYFIHLFLMGDGDFGIYVFGCGFMWMSGHHHYLLIFQLGRWNKILFIRGKWYPSGTKETHLGKWFKRSN